MGDDYSLLNVYIQEPLTDNGQWTKSRCFQRRFEFKRGTLLFGGKQRLKGKWIFFFLITNLEVVTSARIVNRRGSNVYIISFVPLTRIDFRFDSIVSFFMEIYILYIYLTMQNSFLKSRF